MQVIKLEVELSNYNPVPMHDLLRAVEKEFIVAALEICAWNKARAAKLLSLERTTFVEKMRKFELPLLPAYSKGSKHK